jgi:sugar/nucleoside kinase (ribokinase family)
MEGSLELLSIGDAALDVFMTPLESEALCTLDSKECLICFSYGEKIPVKSIEYSVGGNAANNAVGTKRLGINSGILVTLGGDSVGNQIIEKLEKERVDMRYVIQQPTAESNYSTIINYGGERTIFSYHAPRSYEFPVQLEPVPWMYLTSMGESFMPFYNHFVDFMSRNPQVKLAFNPGSRQLRAELSSLKPVLEKTFIIYVNRQEAERLVGSKDSIGNEKDLLLALSALGPKVVVITDGPNGSFLFDSQESKFYKCGIMPVEAYERTGAGDAFGSGFLAAVIRGKSYKDALLWGTVNSASVIGYVGSQRGLLREFELPNWLERASSSGVQVVEI